MGLYCKEGLLKTYDMVKNEEFLQFAVSSGETWEIMKK